MDKDTLQIIIMVAGFAITIIIGLLRFPSRTEMDQQFDDMNQRLIDLRADVRNIYHILIQGKIGESEQDD